MLRWKISPRKAKRVDLDDIGNIGGYSIVGRSHRCITRGTLAVPWWTTPYALVTGSLLEIGENERFRSELGPVPTLLAGVVVTAVVRAAWSGWERRWRGDTSSAGSLPTPAQSA